MSCTPKKPKYPPLIMLSLLLTGKYSASKMIFSLFSAEFICAQQKLSGIPHGRAMQYPHSISLSDRYRK